jgi:hypothetical protein
LRKKNLKNLIKKKKGTNLPHLALGGHLPDARRFQKKIFGAPWKALGYM